MVAMVVFVLAGYQIGEMIAGPTPDPFVYRNWYALVLAAGALGLLLGPYLTIRPFTWIRSQIQHLSGAVLAAGTVGLVIGLVIAVLLAFPLSMLPGQLGRWLPLASALFWGLSYSLNGRNYAYISVPTGMIVQACAMIVAALIISAWLKMPVDFSPMK